MASYVLFPNPSHHIRSQRYFPVRRVRQRCDDWCVFDNSNCWYYVLTNSLLGEEYLDVLHLAPGLSITNQSIGVALVAVGFDGVDGLLGIGPQVLTYGTTLHIHLSPYTSPNLKHLIYRIY